MSDHVLPGAALRTLHVANLAGDDYAEGDADRPVGDLDTANVVSSIAIEGGRFHYPVLDLDIRAHLVPSSTPGHTHLYLDVAVPEEEYWKLCDALAEAHILQEGYVRASKSRGYTSVRLPWIKKDPR